MDIDIARRHSGNADFYPSAGIQINMRLLRKYQLDIIFLFFALALIVWLAFYALKYLGADPHEFEWFMSAPVIILYAAYILQVRDKINISERRKPTGASLVYWIVLGIILIATFLTPVAASDYWSLNIFYVIFTLFLADSYWDFKKITVGEVAKGK